jgi:hypothetical protein
MLRSWIGKDEKVHQFEAVEPKLYDARVRHRVFRGLPPNERDEVIAFIQVRDYLNFTASWTKYMIGRGNAHHEKGVIKLYDVWMEICKEAFNETNYVGTKYTLLYDQFVQSMEYRKGICLLINGDYNERTLDVVPNGGAGSSFDGYKYQDNGRQMDVLNRWKWFLTEEGSYYQRYLQSKPEVLEYYMEHFDLNEAQSNFVKELLK